MNRGSYGSIIKNTIYKDSEKNWQITLIRSTMYWYDLIVNQSGFPFKRFINQSLKDYKQIVEQELEKRFIYYICKRVKVRFSSKQPRYSILKKSLIIYLKIGAEQKRKKVTIPLFDLHRKVILPKVWSDDRFITFQFEDGNLETYSIHDFLLVNGIELGFDTSIEYVGLTKNPHKRPTNSSHSGLADVLYKSSNEHYDIFIFFNLFKVMTHSENVDHGLTMFTPNSMTDEVDVESEGSIIEKSLIYYFAPFSQTRNKSNEIKELENKLLHLSNGINLSSIEFKVEMEEHNEYFRFSSSRVKANDEHHFRLTINNGVQLDLLGQKD